MPKITARFIATEVSFPDRGQLILRDTELKGFGVRVTEGTMSYIAECRVNGRPRRITIGRCDLLTPEEARKEARKILGQMSGGYIPGRPRRCVPTLNQVLKKFFATRNLRTASVRHYKAILHRCLSY